MKASKSYRQRYLYIQKTLHHKQKLLSLPKQPFQSSQTLPLQTRSSNDNISSLLHDAVKENEKLQNEVHLCQQQQLMLQHQLMEQQELKQQLKEYASSLAWEQMMRNQDCENYEKKMNRIQEAHYNSTQRWKALVTQKDQRIVELENKLQRLEKENDHLQDLFLQPHS